MTAFRALVVDVLHEAAHRLIPLLESSSALPLAVVRPKMRQHHHYEYTTVDAEVDATGSNRIALANEDEVLLVVGNGGGGSGGTGGLRMRATNNVATSMSMEDPVYDQVC